MIKELKTGELSKLAAQPIQPQIEYEVTDMPEGGITNAQMLAAQTTTEGFYQIGSVYTCTDDGTYTKKHQYKFNGAEEPTPWEDVTPLSAVDQTYDATSPNAQSGVAIEGAKFVRNTATGSYSITLGGTATTRNGATNVGSGSVADGYRATSYGNNASATAQEANALGFNAQATAQGATQIGAGTNNEAGSFQVGNKKLMNGSGVVPSERLVTITKDTTSAAATQELAKRTSYRYTLSTGLTSLAISFPTMSDDYESELVFKSGSTATTFSATGTIQWSGDDVASNVFTPVASKTYTIEFWYDSVNLNAIVRGV